MNTTEYNGGLPGIYDKPTKENLEKAGIVKITETDGGMYQRRLHTYTYNNKLLGGHGYGFGEDALIYRPETDFVLIDDTTGMSLEELQEVYPNKYYSYYDV